MMPGPCCETPHTAVSKNPCELAYTPMPLVDQALTATPPLRRAKAADSDDGRRPQDSICGGRQSENASLVECVDQPARILVPRLAIDASAGDGCARHAGDVYPSAQGAGKIRIPVHRGPSFGLWVANLPPMATVGSNAVKPAAELATDLEAWVKARFIGDETPSRRPGGFGPRLCAKCVIE